MAGSNKRRRGKIIASRCLDEEFDAIAAKADKAGLAVAAFMRAAALGDPGPRAQRRPPADQQVLREGLGQLGRVGNNLNQIARALNIGKFPSPPELKEALDACKQICGRLYEALGKKPGADP
jgi:Bacterial mobilisation protein (MobC)